MSQENVEVVRRSAEAFNRQDARELAALCEDDVEIIFGMFTGVDAGGTPYRGTEFWSSYFARLNDTWEEWNLEEVEIFDAGDDQVAAVYRVVGKGRASGVPVERVAGGAFTLRNGKLSRVRSYLDPNEALEAVGLSE